MILIMSCKIGTFHISTKRRKYPTTCIKGTFIRESRKETIWWRRYDMQSETLFVRGLQESPGDGDGQVQEYMRDKKMEELIQRSGSHTFVICDNSLIINVLMVNRENATWILN